MGQRCVFYFISGMVLVLALLPACSRQKKTELEGYYECSKYNFIERSLLWPRNESYPLGNTLLLNPDSTFVYTTCGNIVKGSWKVKTETLLLFCESNTRRDDSRESVAPHGCGTRPAKYRIHSSGMLEDSLSAWVTGKRVRVYERLVKSGPRSIPADLRRKNLR